MKKIFVIFIFIVISNCLYSQQNAPSINGYILNEANNRPVAFATIIVEGTPISASANDSGYYQLTLTPGLYNIQVSAVGYEPVTQFEVQTSISNPVQLNIYLKPKETGLAEVVVRATRDKTIESPI